MPFLLFGTVRAKLMESALKGWTTAALALSVLILSVLVLGITTRGVSQPQSVAPPEFAIRAGETGTAHISLLPSELHLTSGQKTQLAVFLEAEQPVTAVELHLEYVAGVLQISKIRAADFFSQATVLEEEIDNMAGKAKIILGGLSAREGSGQLVFVEVEAGNVGETNLRVASESKVAAVGKEESVLGRTQDARVKVKANE